MRRLARILLTLCSAVSLMLFLAVCALWARSYWAHEALEYDTRTAEWSLFAAHGRLRLAKTEWAPDDELTKDSMLGFDRSSFPPQGRLATDTPRESMFEDETLGYRLYFDRWGFAAVAVQSEVLAWDYAVFVPCWSLALATVVAPAWWAASRLKNRRRPRARAGLCPSCGYDLRASPGRCPECGVAPSKLGRGG